ncbi:pyroglutamyl-peptidase I [Metabacillus sp. GX 13764]|uniref:pyroglutamyl-peptidase I n=1 Tax=Metabacillus kandeliae TaxID=2900151 RepID=UPI001E46AE42|nr:pyroglutamyl-peptidase I [Metabacillus kandeliae]MCD7034078.1 pyroglutamyl-peptidase I [Metabacillus kandeliae]
MMKKVLLTGFDPFGGEEINPSWEAVKRLDGIQTENIEMMAVQLPTVYRESIAILEQQIKKHQPEIVICVGQAGGRLHVTPEKVAINLDDARISDNAGNQPIDREIASTGPAAYFTGLPIKRMAERMKENNIPASVSYTAGTFVCNHIFYGLMDYIHRTSSTIRGGFIHIPFIHEQAMDKQAPSLSLDTIVKAIRIAAVTAAENEADLHIVGGTTH